MHTLPQKLIAEFVGTFALVFFGCGAVVADELTGGALGHLGIAVAFALVILMMVYAFGPVSGAHLNPAVSVGFLVTKRFPAGELAPYIGAQCVGAIAAAFTLHALFPDATTMGATIPPETVPVWRAFAIEVLLTFFLMSVIVFVATGPSDVASTAGVPIGLTVGACALVFGPFTGASMNPARSLGPALAQGALGELWIYLVAPPVGAAAAVVTWIAVKSRRTPHVDA